MPEPVDFDEIFKLIINLPKNCCVSENFAFCNLDNDMYYNWSIFVLHQFYLLVGNFVFMLLFF